MTTLTLPKKQEFTTALSGIENDKKMAEALLNTGHYQKLGLSGVFAIIQMARSLNEDIFQCLNGGLYPVDGKVEMDGRLMMARIRKAGHSVVKDPKSTATLCILHGKRADNGDTWSESFSIEDAKLAGLLSRGTYQKYGRLLFQWRALSALARFLFPDVIRDCYAMGEISLAPALSAKVDLEKEEIIAKQIISEINEEQIENPSIDFPIPKDVDVNQVNEYFKILSDQFEISIEDLKTRALKKPEEFWAKFNEWKEKK